MKNACVIILYTTITAKVSKMKNYEDLPRELKAKIEEICELDPYGLSSQTLYKNIYAST